jgi:hypothetical protein
VLAKWAIPSTILSSTNPIIIWASRIHTAWTFFLKGSMLWAQYGSKSHEVTEKWRYVHNAEIHNSSPSAINKTKGDALEEM